MERSHVGPCSALICSSLVVVSVVAAIAVAGCSGKDEAGRIGPSGQVISELRLMVAEEEVVVPLEMMDIFLVESDAYPETFEMRGRGVLLVGEFPLDVHAGYEANLEVLRGRNIALQPSGGGRGEPKASILTLPGGARMAVLGGSFVVEESSGPQEGVKGDGTLSGPISIQAQDAYGVKTLEGTFFVQATTWG